jgi:type IV pilus assembly protein PilW
MKPSTVENVNFALHTIEGNMRFQRGLSLVELMISITLGLVILASLSTLFVNQTKARVELDKSNRMIENGRYAMDLLVNDVQLAGFFGEYVPTVSTCTSVPDGVWGSDAGVNDKPAPPAGIATSQLRTGSDIIMIRRVSTETPTAQSAAVNGVKYLQVSHCQFDTRNYVISTTKTDFTLRPRTCTATSTTPYTSVRKMLEHAYFISPDNESGDGIPTLKVLETDQATGLPTIRPLAEGIEYMQIDYGVDSNSSFTMTATTTSGGLVLTDLSADPVLKRVKQGMGVYDQTSNPNKKIPAGYVVNSMTQPTASPPALGTITLLQGAGADPIVAGSGVPLTIPYLTATITPDSEVLTNTSADPKMSLVRAGLEICGVGIQAGTTVASVNTTTITLTKKAVQCNATDPALPCPSVPLNIPAIAISPVALPGDGVADVFTAAPASTSWPNVVSVKITLLARNTEKSNGYTDTKTYSLGRDSAGNVQTVGPFNDQYKRHVFTQFIRLTNMAGRREAP